jgi:hypothetical protein
MKTLLSGLFSRKSGEPRSRHLRRRGLEAGVRQLERLEQRLAMAINLFTPSTASGSVAPWAVIVSDSADDVYVRQIASAPDNLLIADNSSFLNPRTLVNVNAFTSVYATNGTPTSVSSVRSDETASTVTEFLLHRKVNLGDTTNPTPVGISVSYAGNTWNFQTGGIGGGGLTLTGFTGGTTSAPNLIYPTGGFVNTSTVASVSDSVTINWSLPPRAALGDGIDVPSLNAVYAVSGGTTYVFDGGLAPSSGSFPTFSLPVTATNPGGIVPGTLTGVVQVDGFNVSFRMNNLFTPLPGNSIQNQLFFGNENAGGAPSTTGTVIIPDGTATGKTLTVTGFVNYDSGRIFLDFRNAGLPQAPGNVVLQSLRYAVYNQDAQASSFTVAPGLDFSRELFVDQLAPGSSINFNSPVLQSAAFPNGVLINATNINVNAQVRSTSYFDVNTNRGVVFEHPFLHDAIVQTASAQAIVSPTGEVSAIALPAGGGGQGYDDDPLNAPTVTITGGTATATGRGIVVNGTVIRWEVVDPGAGFPTAQGSPSPTVDVDPPPSTDAAGDEWLPQLPVRVPETLNFNAAVAAPTAYSFTMGDDPSTDAARRGTLFVSPTGSLSGALATTAAGVATASGAFRLTADVADVIVEGTIFATSQSYLMRSTSASADLAPFVFTTRSPLTGADTGLIRGASVSVTLGNEMPTPEEGASAASIVNLRTQIDSLRINAATAAGKPLAGPYPYELTINEVDNISFDAVAASGLPIILSAVGTIDFTAALQTAGDLSITAGGAFTVSAPLSTWRGQVQIVGPSLTVSNSIRVLDSISDPNRTDIVLTATAGDLSLTGPVTAVNDVRLVQRNKTGTAGTLGGQTRVIARGIVVEAEGAADLRTDAVTLEGRSGGTFTLDELNDITITSLRAPGFVTLSAGGIDPGADSPTSPNEIALSATLTDVVNFSASAPRGSVNVVNNVSKTMTIGDVAKIGAGTAASMQAGGSVQVRSAAGSVIVADAPLGGGSAIATRVATTGNLVGATYAYNSPGTFASTLTGPATKLTIDGILLSVGDRVLVKNQTSSEQNGVYAVTSAGSVTTPWRLTRTADADTSAELPVGSFIRVAEGTSAGAVFRIGYTPSDNASPISVTTVTNQADAIRVRAATTSALGGVYDAINGEINGPASGISLPAVDGVTLSVGDLVLVRLGASVGGANANGVYTVTDVGSAGTAWQLTRATDPETGNPIVSGYVVTTDGSFRAIATGQAFLLNYDSLGVDPMTVAPASLVTNIGTDNINAKTTFVVSSTAGTNAAAGSLGKMIGLRNANDVSSSFNPDEVPALTFATSLPGLGGAPAGVIRLTQELPSLTKAFAIDGNSRTSLTATGSAPKIVIDGSRIVTTRFGSPVNPAVTEVNGFSFATGSGATGSTAGGSVANMTVGGFSRGAAVKVDGAAGILARFMTLGRNETGGRLANLHGVRVTGNAAGATVLGGTIVGSTKAGISVESGSTNYTVVGTTIGATDQNNAVGIDAAGTGRIGVNPLQGVKATAQTTTGSRTLTLPGAVPAASIYLGQAIGGTGIPAGTTIAAIDGGTITLSAPMRSTGTATLTLGTPSRTIVEQNLTGIRLAGGGTTVTNSDIRNNTYDGIVIDGVASLVQQHTIGTSTKTAASSNQITSNGRWGVNVIAAAAPAANTLLASQKIQGNVFAKLAANKLGNIGVGTAAISTLAGGVYTPDATTFDKSGNQHVKSTGASGSGGSGSSNSRFPWRAR